MTDHIKTALDALQTAKNGLAWYRGECPQFASSSDDEADAEIDAAITALEGLENAEPVAWRYVPSEVWGSHVLTESPEQARQAQEHGIAVEPLFTHPSPARAEPVAAQPTNVAELLAQRVVLLNETWNRSNALAPDVADHLAVCRVLAEGVLRKSAAQPQGACHSKTAQYEQQPCLSSQSEAQTGAQPQGEAVLPNPFAFYQIIQEKNAALDQCRRLETIIADLEEKLDATPQPAMPVVPGWKLVPVEPTLEMKNAAQNRCKAGAGMDWSGVTPQSLFGVAYRAMLTAAPPIKERGEG